MCKRQSARPHCRRYGNPSGLGVSKKKRYSAQGANKIIWEEEHREMYEKQISEKRKYWTVEMAGGRLGEINRFENEKEPFPLSP